MQILAVDHVGIRIRDAERTLAFYRKLGFELVYQSPEARVIVVRNPAGVELNFIVNADAPAAGTPATGAVTGGAAATDTATDTPGNVLMDIPEKHPGITHVALRVDDIDGAMAHLEAQGIAISDGPVRLGGNLSLFVRDPDRTVIELNAPAPADAPGPS